LFLQGNRVPTKRPLPAVNKQIFTFQFWNMLLTGLIWPHRINTSSITSRNKSKNKVSSIGEATLAAKGWFAVQLNQFSWIGWIN
jgi:hypothetical protein